MTNTGRISPLGPAVLAIAALALSACSDNLRSLTGPAAPSPSTPPSPVAGVVLSGSVTDLLGVPLAGAAVTALVGSRPTRVTDAEGNFTFESVESSPSQLFFVSAQKDGYLAQERAIQGASVQRLAIKLPRLFQLPVDESITSVLLASDPYDYTGEPYESDYSYNTKYFAFTTPGSADVLVEISWEQVENSALKMWAFGGETVSERTDSGAVIRLPRGSAGILLVGRPYTAGRLTPSQSLPFTLHTRSVSSQIP